MKSHQAMGKISIIENNCLKLRMIWWQKVNNTDCKWIGYIPALCNRLGDAGSASDSECWPIRKVYIKQ